MPNEQKIHTVRLSNAQKQQELHPDTFQAASSDDVENIVIGSIVKICDNKERFWVIVSSVEKLEADPFNNVYVGVINNKLISGQEYDNESLIRFRGKHIYSLF